MEVSVIGAAGRWHRWTHVAAWGAAREHVRNACGAAALPPPPAAATAISSAATAAAAAAQRSLPSPLLPPLLPPLPPLLLQRLKTAGLRAGWGKGFPGGRSGSRQGRTAGRTRRWATHPGRWRGGPACGWQPAAALRGRGRGEGEEQGWASGRMKRGGGKAAMRAGKLPTTLWRAVALAPVARTLPPAGAPLLLLSPSRSPPLPSSFHLGRTCGGVGDGPGHGLAIQLWVPAHHDAHNHEQAGNRERRLEHRRQHARRLRVQQRQVGHHLRRSARVRVGRQARCRFRRRGGRKGCRCCGERRRRSCRRRRRPLLLLPAGGQHRRARGRRSAAALRAGGSEGGAQGWAAGCCWGAAGEARRGQHL